MMVEHLPVLVALPAPLGTQVAAWVEHDLGWQVVDADGPLAPVIALADHACGALPWIAVVDGPAGAEAVRRHLTAGALDVVGWPHDRVRLPLLASQADRDHRPDPRARVTVAGVAGGVGTSTVALAIGGLLAWAGAAVLVSGGADVAGLAGARDDARAAQGDARVGSGGGGMGAAPGDGGIGVRPGGVRDEAARGARGRSVPVAVPGVAGLAVVGDGVDVVTAAWSGDMVVVDAGTAVSHDTTLVVSRADRGVARARETGLPVVVVGDQPLGARACRRALAAGLVAHLPLSARVARAGLHGHVPAGLPGTFLRTLRAGLARLEVGP